MSPDFAEYLVGFAWGKIHARTVLEPKFKELTAIATLIGIGDSKEHLRLRIQAACRAGCSKEEIVEVIIQKYCSRRIYQALIALRMVKEVADESAAARAAASAGSVTATSPGCRAKDRSEARRKIGKLKKTGRLAPIAVGSTAVSSFSGVALLPGLWPNVRHGLAQVLALFFSHGRAALGGDGGEMGHVFLGVTVLPPRAPALART
ncbi:MAG: carboxymuconolactone decarboxylase family protein [Verrucomicrobiota bacterium]